MALTPQGLADAITAAQGPAETPAIQSAANLALATGIVTYLLANTVVLPTALVSPVGPVTGTGTLS